MLEGTGWRRQKRTALADTGRRRMIRASTVNRQDP